MTGLPYAVSVSCAEARAADARRKGAAAVRRQNVADFDTMIATAPRRPPPQIDRPTPSLAGVHALQREMRLGIVPKSRRV